MGRFSFAFLALDHLRAFIAPFYAWLAVVPRGAYIDLPKALILIASYLIKEIETTKAMRVVPCRLRLPRVELFRADAKAQGADIVFGGWEVRSLTAGAIEPKNSRWFSLRLDRASAPWAYRGGDPFRVIAALEMMATLVCIMLFMPVQEEDTLERTRWRGLKPQYSFRLAQIILGTRPLSPS